jgi:CRISPR/Cas system CMR subunit Cmr6 (Cas7 group RAMP superfamily)
LLKEDKRKGFAAQGTNIQNIITSKHLQIKASKQSILTSKHTLTHKQTNTHITPIHPRFASHTQPKQTNKTIAMASTQTRNGSTSTSASAQRRSLIQKVVGAVKQHNKEVNAAFQALYGVPSAPSSKTASKAPATTVQQ